MPSSSFGTTSKAPQASLSISPSTARTPRAAISRSVPADRHVPAGDVPEAFLVELADEQSFGVSEALAALGRIEDARRWPPCPVHDHSLDPRVVDGVAADDAERMWGRPGSGSVTLVGRKSTGPDCGFVGTWRRTRPSTERALVLKNAELPVPAGYRQVPFDQSSGASLGRVRVPRCSDHRPSNRSTAWSHPSGIQNGYRADLTRASAVARDPLQPKARSSGRTSISRRRSVRAWTRST